MIETSHAGIVHDRLLRYNLLPENCRHGRDVLLYGSIHLTGSASQQSGKIY